jgi:hypothetical protein
LEDDDFIINIEGSNPSGKKPGGAFLNAKAEATMTLI